MNERIACFPSETLYDNRLISSPTVAKRTLLTLLPVPDLVRDDAEETLEPTVVFFDTAGCEFFERSEAAGNGDIKLVKGALGEGSKSNENEAVVVVKWAKKLVRLLQPKVASLFTVCIDLVGCTCSGGGGGHTLSSSSIADLFHVARRISGDDNRECGWTSRTRARGKTHSTCSHLCVDTTSGHRRSYSVSCGRILLGKSDSLASTGVST